LFILSPLQHTIARGVFYVNFSPQNISKKIKKIKKFLLLINIRFSRAVETNPERATTRQSQTIMKATIRLEE
jgi:hypothetical protein